MSLEKREYAVWKRAERSEVAKAVKVGYPAGTGVRNSRVECQVVTVYAAE
jgi:uncharacterized protein YaeQ